MPCDASNPQYSSAKQPSKGNSLVFSAEKRIVEIMSIESSENDQTSSSTVVFEEGVLLSYHTSPIPLSSKVLDTSP
jgi:hypothetical protein